MRRSAIAVMTATLLALCVVRPPVAGAGASTGSLAVAGDELVFTGYDGFVNSVTVLPAGGDDHVDLYDAQGPIDLTTDLCQPSPTVAVPDKVTCAISGLAVVVRGGDLDDVLSVRDPMSVHLIGDSGNDTLTGWTGDDTLDGGIGDDTLSGSFGDDTLDGGPGNDTLFGGEGEDKLVGGSGADVIDGALGSDTVSYATRFTGVTVDPDGQPGDDGAPGEQDTVTASVENIVGGAGNDTLTGSAGPNLLDGGPGADQLHGLQGVDKLLGGSGFDQLDGGTGPATGVEADLCDPGKDGGALRNCEIFP